MFLHALAVMLILLSFTLLPKPRLRRIPTREARRERDTSRSPR